MSLPIINSFQAFSAVQNYDIVYSWDGNQSYGSTIEVYNNTTNVLVYSNSVTSFLLKNTIVANNLSNGTTYYVKLKVKFQDGTYSQWSDSLVFQCLAIPVVSLNISQSQIIQDSNYNVIFTYSQAQSEELNEWKLVLYDSNSVQLLNTDYIYATSAMNYNLTGLENAKQYQVEIQYVTVHGMT